MAITTLPLMSGSASGSVAGAITFTQKYGNTYVGKKIVKNLSNTANQATVRLLARDIATAWKALSSTVKASWSAASTIPGQSGYNLYFKKAMIVNSGSAYDGTFTQPTL